MDVDGFREVFRARIKGKDSSGWAKKLVGGSDSLESGSL
jgi:hypothetical protein